MDDQASGPTKLEDHPIPEAAKDHNKDEETKVIVPTRSFIGGIEPVPDEPISEGGFQGWMTLAGKSLCKTFRSLG